MLRLPLFVCVSFAFSWSVALALHDMGGLTHKYAAVGLFLFMCGPAVGAFACTLLFEKGHRREALGFTGSFNLWLLWAWLIGIVIVLGATFMSLLGPNVGFQPPIEGIKATMSAQNMDPGESLDIPMINIILLLQGAVLGALINTPLMLSEELGWRGWLWHHLKGRGFWTITGITGVLWGFWHVPIIIMGHNYPDMPIWGPVLFIIFCILYSPVYSLVRERNGSVWAACVLHGTGNAFAGIGLMMLTNIDMPWRGLVGIGGFVMLILSVFFVIYYRRTNPLVTE